MIYIYRCSFSLETEHLIELCAWSDNVCHPGILETDTLMLTDRGSVIRPTLPQTVITVTGCEQRLVVSFNTSPQ